MCETALQREIQAPLPHYPISVGAMSRGARGLYTDLDTGQQHMASSPHWRQFFGEIISNISEKFCFLPLSIVTTEPCKQVLMRAELPA